MLYAIVGLLVIILDQWVKFWTAGHIALSSAGEPFIPGILSLANVHNEGAAFGFLSENGARIPFIILGICLLVYAFSKKIPARAVIPDNRPKKAEPTHYAKSLNG